MGYILIDNYYYRTSAEYRPQAGMEGHARGHAPSISHHCTGRPWGKENMLFCLMILIHGPMISDKHLTYYHN